ncbi:restriction endonuclease subunit S [Streptomyces asoensis]|uniref:restriction endonuclease subunit S n=1 Tax=Streptomyces asoensis TaxID=249586 RepID=UPI00378E98AF
MTSELPAGWESATLGEIGRYLNGRGFKKSEWSTTGRPIIRIQNLTGSGSHFNYFDGELAEEHTARPGDLLISWAATLGVFVWPGPEAAINQHIFKVDSFIDRDFHRYLVEYSLDHLARNTHGSGMVHITRGRFDRTPVAIPPLAEQRRIVKALDNHFSRLDAAVAGFKVIERRERLLAESLTSRAVTGRLLVMESSPLESGIELRREILIERSNKVPRRRATPVAPAMEFPAEVPDHWAMASIDELAFNIEYGSSAKTGEQEQASDVAVLRMGNLQSGCVDTTKLKYLPASHEDCQKLLLADGDLLFNRTNSAELVGKAAVYRSDLGPMTFASYLIRCQFVQGVIPEWVNLVINSTYGRKYVSSVASQQVGQANVNGKKLAAMPIPLPSTAEQRRILDEISRQQARLTQLRQLTEQTKSRAVALRRSMLSFAFTGKLVPQDPGDEPASKLLARIKSEHQRNSRRSGGIGPQSSSASSTYIKEELPL